MHRFVCLFMCLCTFKYIQTFYEYVDTAINKIMKNDDRLTKQKCLLNDIYTCICMHAYDLLLVFIPISLKDTEKYRLINNQKYAKIYYY